MAAALKRTHRCCAGCTSCPSGAYLTVTSFAGGLNITSCAPCSGCTADACADHYGCGCWGACRGMGLLGWEALGMHDLSSSELARHRARQGWHGHLSLAN